MRTLHAPSTKTTTRVLAASHVGVDLTIGAVAGLLPSIRTDLDLTGAQVAVIATVLGTVSSFGQPLAGLVIDRRGARPLAIVSAIATAIVLASVPLLPSYPLLVAVAAIGGLAAAVYHPATAALVRSATGTGSSASALGLFAAGGTIGLAIGPNVATLATGHSTVLASAVLATPGIVLAAVVAAIVRLGPSRRSGPFQHAAPGQLPLNRRISTLVAEMTAVYVASITLSTAVPLWLSDIDASVTIGPTLGVFSLAAAAGGIAGGRISSTRTPISAAHLMLAAPVTFLTLTHTDPGSAAWYLVVAASGALAHLTVPVAIDAAQRQLQDAVAAASGLVMGLPIGLASLVFLAFSVAIDPIRIDHVAAIAAASTLMAAALAHVAFAPERFLRPTRTHACSCTGGALAIAAC